MKTMGQKSTRENDSIIINIAKDFSDTPGFRHKNQGAFSGEEFRERFLDPHFADPNDQKKIIVILDGTAGYATSFLEEAFGGLVREFGRDRVKNRIDLISEEDNVILRDVKKYIEEAKEA